MLPFFSVVIPTFNRAEKLKNTLQSVLSQTFANFEVLVMDDGSTDDTELVVKSFNDRRMHYKWAPNSGGPATPRNSGIDEALSDWVCFLDADDLWYPHKLERVREELHKFPDSDLICHNEAKLDLATKSKSILTYGPYEADFYRKLLLQGNRLSTSATTVKLSFLNQHGLRFNESPGYAIVEDYDMWLRMAFHGASFHFVGEILGEYIIEDDNISSDLSRTRNNLCNVLRDHVYHVQLFDSNKDCLWREIESGVLLSSSKEELLNGRYWSAINFIIYALKSSIAGTLGHFVVKCIKVLKVALGLQA